MSLVFPDQRCLYSRAAVGSMLPTFRFRDCRRFVYRADTMLHIGFSITLAPVPMSFQHCFLLYLLSAASCRKEQDVGVGHPD
jgi:hypothetical protein